VTRQECKTVEKPFTTQVPEEKCVDRLEEVCVPVARQKCDTVQDKVDRLVSPDFSRIDICMVFVFIRKYG
jgi:hypothetical protein